jgi:hypothetical protein
LRLEELEPRIAPTGCESLPHGTYEVGPSLVSPAWFQALDASSSSSSGGLSALEDTEEVTWNGETTQVVSDEWIVQLTADELTRVSSVEQAAEIFSSSEIQFEVLRGLGMAGQLLVQASGAAADTVEEWFSANSSIAYFEPNLVVTMDTIPNDPSFSELWGMNNTGQTGGTSDADIDAPGRTSAR